MKLKEISYCATPVEGKAKTRAVVWLSCLSALGMVALAVIVFMPQRAGLVAPIVFLMAGFPAAMAIGVHDGEVKLFSRKARNCPDSPT